MNRFIAFTAFAALMAGCSDAPVAPRSLHGTGPLFAQEDPPPPPVYGNGTGTFDASEVGVDVSLAVVGPGCSVSAVITQYEFAYKTDNATDAGLNQHAIIKFDEDLFSGEDLSHQIVIHQKPQEDAVVDANGMIVGPGFSFRITGTLPGSTLNRFEFDVNVRGILKTSDGASCEAIGNFFGTLDVAEG